MSLPKVDVVIVGAGRAGKDRHLDAYRAQPGANVVAICDPDLGRARAAAEEKSVPHTHASLEAALEHQHPDIVSVCSPPQFHLEQARQAMQAGAHVLMEKPMAMTLQEADELRKVQLRTGAKFCMVHNYKYEPGVQQALALVERGEIARVMHVERTWLRNGARDRMIPDPDCWCHRLPGGRWTERLPHDIYIPYQFLGQLELVNVQARKVQDRWPWLPADEVLISLQSKSGYLTIRYSANNDSKLHRYMIIHGSNKALIVADRYRATKLPMPAAVPPVSSVRRFASAGKGLLSAGVNRMLRTGGMSRRSAAPEVGEDPLRVPRRSGHLATIEQFVRHVREDADPPVSWEEAYLTMKLVDQIGQAIQDAVDR